jgi:hypothetical protein
MSLQLELSKCHAPRLARRRYREVGNGVVIWPGSLESDGSVPKDSRELCSPGQYLKDNAKDGKTEATCSPCDPGFYQEPGYESVLNRCTPCEKGDLALSTFRICEALHTVSLWQGYFSPTTVLKAALRAARWVAGSQRPRTHRDARNAH